MIGKIIKYLFSEKKEFDGEMSDLDSQKILQVAAAAILIEIAKSDSDFADVELDVIKDILRDMFKLEEDEIMELMEMAVDERDKSSDLYRFTSIINRKFKKEEKISLMEMIWQVVYADGILDKYEDHLAHKFATLLRLDHKELITAKLKVKNSL